MKKIIIYCVAVALPLLVNAQTIKYDADTEKYGFVDPVREHPYRPGIFACYL